MAISWTVDVSVTNLAEDRVRVMATRLDDVTAETRAYGFDTQYNRTLTKNQNLLAWNNQVWNLYQADLTGEAAESGFIADWEALMKANLEGRE